MKKRIVTCLLLAVMLTMAVLSAQSVTAVAFVPGDVDDDGTVTNADALAYFRYIYDAEENPLPNPAVADVNGDGDITNADVLAIFRYIYDAEENPLLFPILPEEEDELPVDPLGAASF